MGIFSSKARNEAQARDRQRDADTAERDKLVRELGPWRGGFQVSGPPMPTGKARRLRELNDRLS